MHFQDEMVQLFYFQIEVLRSKSVNNSAKYCISYANTMIYILLALPHGNMVTFSVYKANIVHIILLHKVQNLLK